ncbi:hypothetical protein CFP56_033623 [Quercus suber]|uniref:Uncharacterized protein n=1 Tax=Quercus suber TaxID=58331 RepID=A0AAW0JFQ3_QUESU
MASIGVKTFTYLLLG